MKRITNSLLAGVAVLLLIALATPAFADDKEVTLTGQGFAPGMKVFVGDGRAAVKVLDANTARIKTPPGKVGVKMTWEGKRPASREIREGVLAILNATRKNRGQAQFIDVEDCT